jgi:uncharacterized protein with von Willebrand factor type A (vWA) domain
MLDLLTGFVSELRAAGLPVSLTETIDAAQAVGNIPLDDRSSFKTALSATLVKSSTHWRAFDTTFEIYFTARGGESSVGSDPNDQLLDSGTTLDRQFDEGHLERGSLETLSAEELTEELFSALLEGNVGRIGAMARHAVNRFAGMEPGRPVGSAYYLFRVLRNLDLDNLLERLLDTIRDGSPSGQLTPLEERLARDEMKIRLDALRRAIEDEIRRRLVADRGSQALSRAALRPLPEDIDVMRATGEELADLHRAIDPLSRRLATRLARRRRNGRRGPLDFRATVRQSLSTGGVPVVPRFRTPRPVKPEIVVIADISGSVASFSRFTLHLVHSLSSHFSKVRTWVFVDGIDEVTRIMDETDDVVEAIRRVTTAADVVWVDGHSDYGHAFSTFWERWSSAVSPRSSVLILGDARNNYHSSQSWVIAEISHRARHLYWLNPEPKSYWGTGDSIVFDYAGYCDSVVECRNLRQLESFVSGLR